MRYQVRGPHGSTRDYARYTVVDTADRNIAVHVARTKRDATEAARELNQRTKDNETKDVHTEHCCQRHGCKYMQVDCTVIRYDRVTGKYIYEKSQSFPCELCYFADTHQDAIEMNEIYEKGYKLAASRAWEFIAETYGTDIPDEY